MGREDKQSMSEETTTVEGGQPQKADENRSNEARAESTGSGSQSERELLQEALAQAQQKAEDNWNQYLRMAAELENMRRRTQREVENAHRYGLERFANDLLGVGDSLELGLKSAGEHEAEGMREGMEMTLKLFRDVLARHGIEAIDPAGEAFDPQFHEAMAMQPASQVPANTVLDVVQKGYRLYDRLLRPARVIVSREPEEDTGKSGRDA